ncbi:hypothetical protein [Vibrio sp. D431a]|uniref:hypothetical protein n=1 Tax=Vibrio sp. D431a TaxID=2837388 RepID=UPI002552B7D8|nr:hypothetical protein [Vibrio sp. D431a]MDK9793828.1 hypothetical protein [Vibrio sp. D431a]
MNSQFILNTVKVALANEVSHFNIRLIIKMLSFPDEVLDIRKKIDGADRKISDLDAFELTNLNINNSLKVIKTKRCTYSLIANRCSVTFKGKDAYQPPNEDQNLKLAKQGFEIWLEQIGNDKNLFKRTPSLTSSKANKFSKGGRLEAMFRAFKNGDLKSLEEVKLVCTGARTSLYHVGYDKYGRKLSKNYCDIPTLFLTRQRIEELIQRSVDGKDYLLQLEDLSGITKLKNRLDGDEFVSDTPITLEDLTVNDMHIQTEELSLEDLL